MKTPKNEALAARIEKLERELSDLRAALAAAPPAPAPAPVLPPEPSGNGHGAAAVPELPASLEVLVLAAGEARVAVPLAGVVEVIPRVLLATLPNAPPGLAGYMRWRGEHVPVVDLGARWSGRPLPVRLEDRIVVLRHQEALRALLVDRVEGVDRFEGGQATAVPAGSAAASFALALVSRGHGSMVLVDLGRLLEPASRAGTAEA